MKTDPRPVRIIVAGGRNYVAEESHLLELINILLSFPNVEIVSGGAAGADAIGEFLAKKFKFPCTIFHASWKTYKRAAGPIRNTQMAEYADELIALPGGKGTANMIHLMRERNKKVYLIGDHNESKTS